MLDGASVTCAEIQTEIDPTLRKRAAKRLYDMAFREANKETLSVKRKAYCQANKAMIKANKKVYYQANKERVLETARKRRLANGDSLREKARAYSAANRDKRSASYRKSKYGLTLEDIAVMKDSQDDRCAICLTPFSLLKFHIDHDHETERVRGLLCSNCNKGLGFFQDNASFMRRAIRYLEPRDEDAK